MIAIHRASRRTALLLAGLLGLILFHAPARAQSATTNLGANLNVTAKCRLDLVTVAFGSTSLTGGPAVVGTGGVWPNCTTGVTWTASAGVGNGPGATISVRKMQSGQNTLNYTLYTDSARTIIWGDGTGGTGVITGVGTDAMTGIAVYGRIFAGQQSTPAGDYVDFVVITLTF